MYVVITIMILLYLIFILNIIFELKFFLIIILFFSFQRTTKPKKKDRVKKMKG